MPDQIYIGDFPSGLTLNKEAFNIDNTAFPNLFNMYQWRGRAKRKRGTQFLAQLQRQIVSVNPIVSPWQLGTISFSSGYGNLLQYLGLINSLSTITNISNASQAVVTIAGHSFVAGNVVYINGVTGMTGVNGTFSNVIAVLSVNTFSISLNTTSSGVYGAGGNAYLITGNGIVPGSLSIINGGFTYTDPAQNGTLYKNGVLDSSSSINYASGAIFISGGAATGTGTFSYYPGLPVMGLADFDDNTTTIYPVLLAFDTKYSYQIDQSVSTTPFYNTTFYKNTGIPFTWTGQDYQQFWTTNYSSALWATNGKPGFHYKSLTNTLAGSSVVYVSATRVTVGLTAHGLNLGDYLWFNEVSGTIATGSGATANQNINGQTGKVFAIPDANTLTVDFTGASGTSTANFQAAATGTGGIAQFLTHSIADQDGIRWYDGDPTGHNGIPQAPFLGWVNFSPPLTATTVSIDNRPAALYYLVGARAILPFKDRLLFFKPVIQAVGGNPLILQDTVLWSWNGTPYYNALVPTDNFDPQTFNPIAYYVDQTGAGGYLPAGIPNPIVTVNSNEDVLLVGFGGDGRKTRFVYTGNDLQPFLFFNINNELPSSATFSSISLDRGCIDIGQYGLAQTDQQSSQRVDLQIPNEIFKIQNRNNGVDRVNAIRDFINEWIYFTYPVQGSITKFPTQTFLYNYRDVSWAILYENYTTHGNYRPNTKKTWQTLKFKTWNSWREPWNSGTDQSLQTKVIAGNPEGYVLIIGEGTYEAPSGTISAIQSNIGGTQITSTNHCLTSANPNTDQGDYIYITGALGITGFNITGITLGTTTVITATTDFIVGQLFLITGIVGTTQLNNFTYEVTAVTGTTVTIDVDSTDFNAWISGGVVSYSFNNRVGKVTRVIDDNNFVVDIDYPDNTYLGSGKFARLSQPIIQTKQFPVYWQQGRQVRLGSQKYLLEKTANAQVTLNIYLSQDPDNVWNNTTVDPPLNSLIYTQTLYTCSESTNIGLTPANTNLQMPIGETQKQIWHRMNTSLIGDSVQLGITLSEAQMKDITYATAEIALHAIQMTVYPGPQLA